LAHSKKEEGRRRQERRKKKKRKIGRKDERKRGNGETANE
jgi:hypothetical protein